MDVDRCISAVHQRVRAWITRGGLCNGDIVDTIADEIWDEATTRAHFATPHKPAPTLPHILEEYQRIALSVSIAVFIEAVPQDTQMDELVCEALIYTEHEFAGYSALRLHTLLTLLYANVDICHAKRAEAALFAAHQDSRLYAMHAHKLAQPHTLELLHKNEFDAEDAWHFIEGVTAEHDDNEEVPENTLLQCPKCKERKVSYFERQTRSADEPTTKFACCHHTGCHFRWKFC